MTISSQLERHPKLLSQVLSQLSNSTFVVAITGPDCAGKSTAAKRLLGALKSRGYDVSVLEVDSYVRPRRQRTGLPNEAENYYREGFDFDQLLSDLDALKSQPTTTASHAQQIIIVEGVFLLKSEIAHNWDVAFWLDVSDAEILKRGARRDAEFFGSEAKAAAVYESQIIPAQHLHLDLDHPKYKAHLL